MTALLLLIFFQAGSPSVTIALIGLAGAAVGVIGTGLFNRVRQKTASLKDATDSWSSMAALLKVTMQDLLQALSTIRKLEVDMHLLSKQVSEAESKREMQSAIVETFKVEATIIIDHLSHLSFVSTSTPTAEDEKVVRRLREMKQAAERMTAI